jgi:hypothetical protein
MNQKAALEAAFCFAAKKAHGTGGGQRQFRMDVHRQ